ncbi:MAG: GTP-binding protein [Candidatus Lokiarchaeota archaeon]|nr:GTP-binding protein [Candidatus Lokiarchaeota archaeon]
MAAYVLKVVIAGEGGVGKTALLMRFTKGVFIENTKMTIGVDFSAVKIKASTSLGEKVITLQIWDFGGESRFRFILPGYCVGASGAVVCFDLTRPETLKILPEWIELIRSKVPDIPIILVGTKADLDDKRKISREYAEEKVKEWNLSGYIESSSKTGDNIGYVFGLLSQEMLMRIEDSKK